jgi:hypothetical protein
MTGIAILCIITVATASLHVAARSRGQAVAEYLVDCMYRWAAICYALAQAADAALCRYRRTLADIRSAHQPMYLEIAE